MLRIKQHEFYIWIIALTLFYGYLGYIIPLHGTDWFWGSTQGMQIIDSAFDNFNGRYLNNLLEFASVQFVIFRVMVYALISILLIFSILNVLGNFTSIKYVILISTLLLIIPNTLFAQSYGNFELFYTYVFGTCLSLNLLNFIIKVISNKSNIRRIEIALFWLICLVGQWFAEPLTFYNSVMICIGLVYYLYSNHKLNFNLVLGFMISLCGALCMLLNNKYINMFSSFKSLREHLDIFGLQHKLETTLFKDIPQYLFFNNIIIISILTILLLFLLLNNKVFQHYSKLKQMILICGLSILPLYRVFIYVPFNLKQVATTMPFNIIHLIICALFIVSLSIACSIVISKRDMRLIVSMAIISILVSVLPTFLIAEVTVKQFYLAYVLMLMITVILCIEADFLSTIHYKILKSCILIVALIYIFIFTDLHILNDQRNEDIKAQLSNNEELVKISHLPYENYFYEITPTDENDQSNFREFHKISDARTIKVLPFEE